MLLHPRNLKHHVAASSRGRYALNAIALTNRGTLSTDGYSLLFVPYPEEDTKKAPKVDGVDATATPPRARPFLLDPSDAQKAAKMVGKGKRHLSPYTELVQAEIEGNSIRLGATDLSNSQVLHAGAVEGNYPDVGAVIPDYEKSHAVSINLDTLLRSLKALKGATQEEVVTLRVVDDQTAVGFSCKDGAAMLVMPIQVEKPEAHIPDQLAALKAGPPVAAPAAPEDDEDSDDKAGEPVETEASPAPAKVTPKKRRSRGSVKHAPDELAAIIGV